MPTSEKKYRNLSYLSELWSELCSKFNQSINDTNVFDSNAAAAEEIRYKLKQLFEQEDYKEKERLLFERWKEEERKRMKENNLYNY